MTDSTIFLRIARAAGRRHFTFTAPLGTRIIPGKVLPPSDGKGPRQEIGGASSFALATPERLVIDIVGATEGIAAADGAGGIDKIRIGTFVPAALGRAARRTSGWTYV